jgi:3-phenylpropionate/trans-cinnamate dioxygenase ferredoxin reductase component
MPDFELLIVGGGLATARAIKSYREAGGEGRIALVSADNRVPYHRPPLSKRFLRGESTAEDAQVEPESFYAENDVELLLETRVARVDPGAREVELEGGRSISWAKLLLATGAWPQRLDAPGADRDGVLYLRTVDSSSRIKAAARDGARAVVVGAGFIGMEVAASLTQLGVEVTLVHHGEGLYDQFGVPELARQLVDVYRERGVEVVLEDEVVRFDGDGRFTGVVTRRGRTFTADFAVVGIGVAPVTSLLEGSGLEVDDGIVVDERFRTRAERVYAAGDVARFRDPVFDRIRRIEHWSNANYQGTEVGKVLAGVDAPYDTVSTFFTEVFGNTLKVFGDSTLADDHVLEGSVADGKLLALYLGEGKLVGALLLGQEEETENRLKELLREQPPVKREALEAADDLVAALSD